MLDKAYFLILSIVLGGIGGLVLARRLRAWLRGVRTVGTVVDWEPCDRIASFHPVVEFTTCDGVTHRLVGESGSSERPTAQRLPVIYLRREPRKAWVYSFGHFWLPPVATLLMTCFALYLFLRV